MHSSWSNFFKTAALTPSLLVAQVLELGIIVDNDDVWQETAQGLIDGSHEVIYLCYHQANPSFTLLKSCRGGGGLQIPMSSAVRLLCF